MRSAVLLSLATAALAGFARPAAAQYAVTFVQVGPNVVATGAGSIDLNTLTLVGTQSTAPAFAFPNFSQVLTGAVGTADVYTGSLAQVAPFGSGMRASATTAVGDIVGGIRVGSGFFIDVPAGYVSGAPVSDQATYNAQTFATLGLTPGTYQTTWDNGQGSFTVQIGPAAVTTPEPSTWTLAGVGLLGVSGVAMRRRRSMINAGVS